MSLKTDYIEDILASSNTRRKYNMITNDDGTVSFEDVTDYTQVGDSFGASDINGINTEVNANSSSIEANTNSIAANAQAIKALNDGYRILGVAYTAIQEIGSSATDKKIEIKPPAGTIQIIPFFDYLDLSANSTLNGIYVTHENDKWYLTAGGTNVRFQMGYFALNKARE